MTEQTIDEVPAAVLRVLVAIHGDDTSDGDEADFGGDVPTTGRSATRPTDVWEAHADVDLPSPDDLTNRGILLRSAS